MNYIVLDLEWNQCPEGKLKENKKLPFEIIEIGAVKLNSHREYQDSFKRMIAPNVYHSLHYITKDLVHTSMKELQNGISFTEAVNEFLEWIGTEEYIFCTWGSMDLTEFQRNCSFYGIDTGFPFPLIFYDLQKSYSLCYSDGKLRVSLENAINEMNIEKQDCFHSAMADADYTAEILKKMDFEKICDYTSIDTFRIPAARKDEFTIKYPTYSKYISMGYNDRDEVLQQTYILSSKCCVCGRNARKKIKWFSSNQKIYYCAAKCEEHGFLKGKMKIKKTDNDLYYAIKIMKLTDEDGISVIRDKQLTAREKRRERRKKEREKHYG